MSFDELLARARMIPVVAVEDAGDAAPLARAILAGGLATIEVTLRTPAALDAIRAMRAVDGVTVGAGTLLTPADVERAAEAGAQFLVSPHLDAEMVQAAWAAGLPYLPGVATASELMQAHRLGIDTLKFFPAAPSGGPAWLKQIHGPFPKARFCPTGGLGQESFADYLACPNVLCVGGGWVAPAARIAAKDWDGIAALCRKACDAAADASGK
jgi:2-dehydro-3-deoxyphosphogluconate aldolase/(4S)-4-hydroxy-2-oxoglutarate aldolase